jgi:protein O-GlcNAc transferase
LNPDATLAKLLAEGQLLAALSEAERLASSDPAIALRHHNLAVVKMLNDRWSGAIVSFEDCLRIDPHHKEARIHYPTALLEGGFEDRAVTELALALAASPESVQLHRTLGRALAKLGKNAQASDAFKEALRLDPTNLKTLDAAFTFFYEHGEESLAADCGARLAQLLPQQAAAAIRCANAHMRAGNLHAALLAYERAVDLDPADGTVHSVFLYAQIFDERRNGAELLAAHRSWAARHCPPIGSDRVFPNSKDPDRRLRVGVLSGELSGGSGSFFVPPLFRHHDRTSLELFAYSTNPTNQVAPYFDHWTEVATLSDDEVEAEILGDQVDILVDISGHLPHRRLTVFGRKPAPVQISIPRYPCTTGLDAIDYRLTDKWSDPIGRTESHYCEKLIHLPGGYLAYEPPVCAPAVNSLPALDNGWVTFGFLQSPSKLNAHVMDTIAAVVTSTKNSRLLIHYAIHDFDRPGRYARQHIAQALTDRGVEADRIIFRGPLPLKEHLEVVAQIDIALDSFPYSGQTTTCECLWMGVPVVTLGGDRHAGRVSTAILYRSHLDGWVAESSAQYVQIATQNASFLPQLATLRGNLRERFSRSPVMNGPQVAREIETAYRSAWLEWCRR